MKITIASHSGVAERQAWFYDYLATQQPDLTVQQIFPSKWGNHTRTTTGGFIVENEGDILNYTFPQEALKSIEEFGCDILYVQNEAYCRVSAQLQRIARRLGSKFILFVWENLQPYDRFPDEARHVLSSSDLVICGSHDAEKLVQDCNDNTEVIIQVGVNTFTFAPLDDVQKDYDLIFQGRMVPEKGIETLKRAAEGQFWKILWPESTRTAYDKVPRRYCRAKVHVGHSIDTPTWREQHGSYANYEAISCGLYVATSHSSGIIESLQGCPGVLFAEQDNASELRDIISSLLSHNGINSEGRKWIESHYGYKEIADRHLEAFDKVLR